jgi:hypothetical protein
MRCGNQNKMDKTKTHTVTMHTNLLLYFTNLSRCRTMKVKPYIILNTSRKHVNYEEDKNKVPMNKPYNIQNMNICNGIFHISFFRALLINEGKTTRGETTWIRGMVSVLSSRSWVRAPIGSNQRL